MFLPVRHHSPACARMARDLIQARQPACVLIEGPFDFNERIEELFLGHILPIAIYSYVAWEDEFRQGAYYPFCVYSPEWQALQAAHAVGAVARFVDLPFACMAKEDRREHRYSDQRLTSSSYVAALCEALKVENFDDAWDLIAEQDPELSAEDVRKLSATYCGNLRDMDADCVQPSDLRRELFMAARIREAWEEFGRDQVIVLTGGYHTTALEKLLNAEEELPDEPLEWPEDMKERGIALTPYSYERLDSLAGYNAGMPNPGFYHSAWTHHGEIPLHMTLMSEVAKRLRELKQSVSTADLIGVETCARSLASLRGHRRVWRRDLLDAMQAALVKDDLYLDHPFILVMQDVLRGGERGVLAEGSPLPPLVTDIMEQLKQADLVPDRRSREIQIELTKPDQLAKSQLLQRMRVLGVPGFKRTAGVDFASRDDLTELKEAWNLRWLPEMDAQMIEASRYGSALTEAVANRLFESASKIERSAAEAVSLLLDAVFTDVAKVAVSLRQRVVQIIHEDGALTSVAKAMDHLLYLYGWDSVFGVRNSADTGALLVEAYDRSLWLLEAGGAVDDVNTEVNAVRLTRNVFEKAESAMELDRDVFAAVLARVQADDERSPAQRGACAGALWSLNCADPAEIRRDLMLFADPDHLGDFLTGLFALAREEVQRDRDLLEVIYQLVSEWNDQGFMTALPSLRLAFMYFTPREKTYLASSLFTEETSSVVKEGDEDELLDLTVSPEEAAAAMAFELELVEFARGYGIDLDPSSEPKEDS